MIIVLFALGAMVCASIVFLAGAAWAALPKLREPHEPAQALRLVSQSAPERDTFKMAS